MSSPPDPAAATPTIPRASEHGGDDGFADSAAELMNARRGT